MRDRQHSKVIQGSEQLIRVEFHIDRRDLFFLYDLVQIIRIEVHNDIEVLLFVFVSQETISHLEYIGMFKDLQYEMLTVFILFVLEYFLDSDFLSSLFVFTRVYDSKCPFPC